jgi:serine/threonine protein kinase
MDVSKPDSRAKNSEPDALETQIDPRPRAADLSTLDGGAAVGALTPPPIIDVDATLGPAPASPADPGATMGAEYIPVFATSARPPGTPAGSKSIGPYRLLKILGEGGMGQVWLAEQTAPVRRKVALKLIKGGMYDESVIQRFEAERQSLAIMDHPAIAKVFDAGTSDGNPYFVMEYVPGVPVTQYCDQKRLTPHERLKLFIKICEGVQHAHQKAVIHRDLKPTNILISEIDGKPAPHIIDFGIAKAATPGPDQMLLTQIGSFVGTPGYMSP